ncbi:PLP-dependent aminotransferase family protein [Marinomonas algicola]|uniref:MocR-like pyridoxine biosynthesis transcription factor PdxR n=1 Tax=Marinomonas algicola TaxID=2773454 RepID=UPI00174BC8AE|nr:PLP-dependent aminotransferase family protein [Marinomonas algicola]
MRIFTLTLDAQIKPIFLRIAYGLRHAIQTGKLTSNERLPSARKLAEQLNTNRHTVMAAYQELIAQGWVESIERKGYQVAKSLPIENSDYSLSSLSTHEKMTFKWDINTEISESSLDKPAHTYRYNFAGGSPDVALFPFKDFKSYMNDSLSRPNLDDLNYGNNAGNSHFIEQVTTYLRRVRSITNKEIIAVNGSQEAIYLIARLLLKTGDKVAVESLGYQPAWNAFRATGADLVPIQQHANGIDIEELRKTFSTHNIKLIYLTPLHQYPTTVTLPIHERMAIYQLAAQYNVAILEDDYDHEFHYDSQPLIPLAADDPLGLVIYLSTFSKIMFPGGRIGFMAVHKALLPAITRYRSTMNHKPNVLMQDAIGRWMQDGGFERHLRRMTKRYHQRRDHLIQLLNTYKEQGISLDYYLPAGGMSLWLDIKSHAKELEQACHKNDIYLAAEQHFHLDTSKDENRYVRLGYAGLDSDKLTEGLESMFSLLKDLQLRG